MGNVRRRLRDAISFGSQAAVPESYVVGDSSSSGQTSKRRRLPSGIDIHVEEVRHVGNWATMQTSSGSPMHSAHREAENTCLPLGADEAWQCPSGEEHGEDTDWNEDLTEDGLV